MLWKASHKLLVAATPRIDTAYDRNPSRHVPVRIDRRRLARHARHARLRVRRRFRRAARGRCLACTAGGAVSLGGLVITAVGLAHPVLQTRSTPLFGPMMVGGICIASLVGLVFCAWGLVEGLRRLARDDGVLAGDGAAA